MLFRAAALPSLLNFWTVFENNDEYECWSSLSMRLEGFRDVGLFRIGLSLVQCRRIYSYTNACMWMKALEGTRA